MGQQVSPEESRRIAGWVLNSALPLAALVGKVAWFVWHTAVAVLVAICLAGLALLTVGTGVLVISMMMTKYPLVPPKDN